jgi:hypothetical protein
MKAQLNKLITATAALMIAAIIGLGCSETPTTAADEEFLKTGSVADAGSIGNGRSERETSISGEIIRLDMQNNLIYVEGSDVPVETDLFTTGVLMPERQIVRFSFNLIPLRTEVVAHGKMKVDERLLATTIEIWDSTVERTDPALD